MVNKANHPIMKKDRRQFIGQAGKFGISALFFSHLLACKEKEVPAPEIAKVMKEEIKNLGLDENLAYKMNYLRGNVGFFNERGGTIGWYADKGNLVIVDTQFPEQSEHLLAEVSKFSKSGPDLLINTHHHGDHTAGNVIYKDITKRILAHENSKKNQENSAKRRGNEDTQVYPNETFEKDHSEKIGEETITLSYHGAAHTDGDAIIHFENSNVVHMGDLVFNRRFPYIDISAGANIENWINVLDIATDKFDDEAIYIFGHCGEGFNTVGGKEEIKAFKNYLEKLLEFGSKAIADGMSLDDAKAQITTIPGAPEWKGSGIERSLVAVYDELANE